MNDHYKNKFEILTKYLKYNYSFYRFVNVFKIFLLFVEGLNLNLYKNQENGYRAARLSKLLKRIIPR